MSFHRIKTKWHIYNIQWHKIVCFYPKRKTDQGVIRKTLVKAKQDPEKNTKLWSAMSTIGGSCHSFQGFTYSYLCHGMTSSMYSSFAALRLPACTVALQHCNFQHAQLLCRAATSSMHGSLHRLRLTLFYTCSSLMVVFSWLWYFQLPKGLSQGPPEAMYSWVSI